ncbi:hypothetical protein C8R45DRAFT_414741 [Mycena sanguinolenta]|nr:hypothetical protein C8R45DRAFT_414741 [Mycena sanguinolenta]
MALTFALIRLVVLFTVAVFASIALGVAAATISFLNHTFRFAGFGMTAAVFTLLTVPPLIVLEILRPGSMTSMVMLEIFWFALLAILWFLTGGYTAAFKPGFGLGCGSVEYKELQAVDKEFGAPTSGAPNRICSEISVLEAFAFLNSIILIVYVGTLSVMSLMEEIREYKASVALGPAKNTSVPTSYPHIPW